MTVTEYVDRDQLSEEQQRELLTLTRGRMCRSERRGYACSRRDGHDGPHVAAAGEDFFCAAWPNEGNES